jgi:hypothetical protein
MNKVVTHYSSNITGRSAYKFNGRMYAFGHTSPRELAARHVMDFSIEFAPLQLDDHKLYSYSGKRYIFKEE